MSTTKIKTNPDNEDTNNILNSLKYLMNVAKRLNNKDLCDIIGIAYELGYNTFVEPELSELDVSDDKIEDNNIRAAWFLYKFLMAPEAVQEKTLSLLKTEL